MGAGRVAGVAIALALLGASAAQAAELSVTERLQDRRVVAAGTRAQVLPFADGRFYANGWHTTGEMGGVFTSPLKLLDSLSFGVNGRWVGQATKFTSGEGYTRFDLPPIDGIGLQRTDFVPDGRRGALLGLKLTNDRKSRKTVQVWVDAHSELLSQYPWGFGGVTPNASDNTQDTGSVVDGTLTFRDTGRYPGEESDHSYTAIVGSDRDAKGDAEIGPGHYGPFGAGRRCPGATPDPMPSQCDDGPFGKGTGGRLRYKVELPANGSTTVWVAVAGSDNSPAEARSEFTKLTADPAAALARKQTRRQRVANRTRVDLPGNPLLQDAVDWGKQNLADLTQVAKDLEIRWTNEGREWTLEGTVPKIRWVGAGFPDYPWLFATDGEYTAFASVGVGQFGAIKGHLRALRDVSAVLNDNSGVVAHEVVGDGSVWFGKDTNADGRNHFNTDEMVKLPGAVALVWRWSGDDGFRDEMLDASRRALEYVRTKLDTDGDGWPEGNGNVERPGMGAEKLDNAVDYIRGLYDFADMTRDAGNDAEADEFTARADALKAKFESDWWMPDEHAYADSLTDPGNVPVNQKHWIGVTPTEAEIPADGGTPLADPEHAAEALAARENDCYSGVRPGNLGLYHTGCGGGPEGQGEFGIFSLNTSIQAVGEGAYGRTGTSEQRRYTDANAETMFSEPATGGTPDEMPGAMPEIMPSEPSPQAGPGATGTPPNIDRCWTCRSMVMQAWGNYGTVWPVVHQMLGVRPDLGRGALTIAPAIPEGQPSVAGTGVRLGTGSASVSAEVAGNKWTVKTDTSGVPGVTDYKIGVVVPHGTTEISAYLDGEPAAAAMTVETPQGIRVTVPTSAGSAHTLEVTSG